MMKKKIFKIVLTAVLAACALCGCQKESGDKAEYPTKSINVIVPFAPGGGSDVLTRSMMEYLKLPNDQNFVAVNVEGAGGYVGCEQAYNSANDGYTLLAHNPMDMVSYTLGGTTDTELYKELELICGIADDFNFLVTNQRSGWTSIEDMVEYVKAHPGEVKVGNTGSMNCNMADGMRVLEELGIEDDVTIVPYNSGADNKVAVMGNHVQLSINTGADITASVASGDLVPLLAISDRRSQALPDTPCTKELGYDVVTTKPRALYAPKGTSAEQLDIIRGAVEEVCANEEFQEKVLSLGLEVNYVAGEELQQKIDGWVEDIKPVFEEMKQMQ
ncbi:MAG: tripartite tricarboxylate transporter substrate binding protein [Clostridiales bacterium]|nr:tripartite tricarboxylate transporter substrate binding protein [Clostridiales bacterium]